MQSKSGGKEEGRERKREGEREMRIQFEPVEMTKNDGGARAERVAADPTSKTEEMLPNL